MYSTKEIFTNHKNCKKVKSAIHVMICAIEVYLPGVFLCRQIENMSSYNTNQEGKMKGIIYHANISRGMYSAKLNNGSFTVFELVDPIELSRNTELSGEFEEFGDRDI
jgi:hypothetical protein